MGFKATKNACLTSFGKKTEINYVYFVYMGKESPDLIILRPIALLRLPTFIKMTYFLLDLGWVSGSCPRIQDDSSPHHSVQHECL
jgi:hypothetical protein